jgi:hypothetical protein
MWDTLNTEYGGSDVDTELYIIEQYHDCQMVDGKVWLHMLMRYSAW